MPRNRTTTAPLWQRQRYTAKGKAEIPKGSGPGLARRASVDFSHATVVRKDERGRYWGNQACQKQARHRILSVACPQKATFIPSSPPALCCALFCTYGVGVLCIRTCSAKAHKVIEPLFA